MSNTPNEVKKDAVARVTHADPYSRSEPAALYLNPTLFDQAQRAAMLLSKSGTIPKHLQDNVSDCFLVLEQASRWGLSPFAVAQGCYVLQGKLGYEGKLIAGVVNSSPALKTKLNYSYSGSGLDREVRVYGTLRGEEEPREVRGTVKLWRTTNKQWETQTDQMLSYRGAREWARRHMPETILGVYAEEELPQIVQQARTVEVSIPSVDDFGEVVSASNDPKTAERKPEPPVEAEIVKPTLDPQDAEIDKLFTV
jgi:hypothetical protein